MSRTTTKPLTKVAAIAKVIAANRGTADLATIYRQIGRYYKGAKASHEWQAGIRGVIYRELRNGRTFRRVGPASFSLIDYIVVSPDGIALDCEPVHHTSRQTAECRGHVPSPSAIAGKAITPPPAANASRSTR